MHVGVMIILLGAILLCAVIPIIAHILRGHRERIEEFAISLGLQVMRFGIGDMELAGKYKGKTVYIQNKSGENENDRWLASVDSESKFAESGKIEIHNQGSHSGLFTRIGRILTADRLILGNPEFDNIVLVRTRDQQAAKAFFDFDVQNRILHQGPGKTTIGGGHVHFEGKGKAQDNEGLVRRTLDYLYNIEESLNEAPSPYLGSFGPKKQPRKLKTPGVLPELLESTDADWRGEYKLGREIPQKPEIVERKSHLGTTPAKPVTMKSEKTIPQKPEPKKESESHNVEMAFFEDDVNASSSDDDGF